MDSMDDVHEQIKLIQSVVIELSNDLQKINLKYCIKQSLLEIRKDIVAMEYNLHCLLNGNNQMKSEIVSLSKQIELFQSHEVIVDILYLDDEYCIVNKPPNIRIDGDEAVTLEKLTLNTLNINKQTSKIRHCHQLDRATSGILIYALTQKAAFRVNELFKSRKIIKIYYCIAHGHIESDHFVLDYPLITRKYKQKIADDAKLGKHAVTECFVEERGYFQGIKVSLVKVLLHTGRRHQIRLHLSHFGHPIIGDPMYWDNVKTLRFKQMTAMFDRMYLDSYRIVVQFDDESHGTIDVSTNSKQVFNALIQPNEPGNLA